MPSRHHVQPVPPPVRASTSQLDTRQAVSGQARRSSRSARVNTPHTRPLGAERGRSRSNHSSGVVSAARRTQRSRTSEHYPMRLRLRSCHCSAEPKETSSTSSANPIRPSEPLTVAWKPVPRVAELKVAVPSDQVSVRRKV